MILKKVTIGNPLFNLGKISELALYESVQNDEELATLYHIMLDDAERNNNEVYASMVMAMIGFSTGVNINPQILL